jgi:hypothetical protein
MLTLVKTFASLLLFSFAVALTATCDMQQQGVSNANTANSNVNVSNIANTNSNISNSTSTVTVSEANEPSEYQATVAIRLEGIGTQPNRALPTLSAKVARNGNDRRMEFTMPAGGHVVYLDKAGTNYLILPDMKQYAELNQESLGFDVRRMMMPGEIVQQVKTVPGVTRVGEEQYYGRAVIKYQYGSTTNTNSNAGQIATQSFLYVDKATGLPLHSETVSQSTSGQNVQGFTGVRVITDITDISTTATADMFMEPTGMQKVESEQLRAQINMIFNAIGSMLAQMMNQPQSAATPAASPSATATR